MNFYLKVARRLFVVLIVMSCGGWYSDNRGDDVYVKRFGEITELNTAIARDGDPAGLLVNKSSEKYKVIADRTALTDPHILKIAENRNKTKMPKSNTPSRVERTQGRGSRLRDIKEGIGKGRKDIATETQVSCTFTPKVCAGYSTDNPCLGNEVTSVRECEDKDGNFMGRTSVTYCCPKKGGLGEQETDL